MSVFSLSKLKDSYLIELIAKHFDDCVIPDGGSGNTAVNMREISLSGWSRGYVFIGVSGEHLRNKMNAVERYYKKDNVKVVAEYLDYEKGLGIFKWRKR